MGDGTAAMIRRSLVVLGGATILALVAIALLGGGSPERAGAEPVGRAPGLHSMR